MLRQQRRAIPEEMRKSLDEGIFNNTVASPLYRDADTLLLYVSGGGEPDTLQLIARALDDGKAVALPRCLAAGTMDFFLIESMEAMQPGAYGIPEPVGDRKPMLTERSVCFVPGVAFSPDGNRLGQGGGYYDRFLEANPRLRTAGLCYCQLLLEEIPCERHDRRVNAVITERSVEVCNVIEFRK